MNPLRDWFINTMSDLTDLLVDKVISTEEFKVVAGTIEMFALPIVQRYEDMNKEDTVPFDIDPPDAYDLADEVDIEHDFHTLDELELDRIEDSYSAIGE